MNSTHAFTYIDKHGILTAIDAVSPYSGRSYWFSKTQQELEQEYGAPVSIMAWEEYEKQHDAMFITPPTEITQDEFCRMLEVLPPDDWQHSPDNAAESFKMIERTSGQITGIYARIGERYFGFSDDYHMTHADIIAVCQPYADAASTERTI